MRNLVSNAIKFTDAGGSVSISADVDSCLDGRRVLRIAVTDTGVGISKVRSELIKLWTVVTIPVHDL